MILVDTGPLVAAANRRDDDHDASLAALAAAQPPRLVPGVVIAQVAYLLARDGGSAVESAFLRSFKIGFLTLAEATVDDLQRAADLVERYADLPLGATDALVVAIAERLQITEIATLDRRHFSVVRPIHTEAFTLVP
jgi:predicted nucleic acid-binding protein